MKGFDMKYQQKPIEVDVWQWNGQDKIEHQEWLLKHIYSGKIQITKHIKFGHYITLYDKRYGNQKGVSGDYIIGFKDHLRICPQNLFSQLYQPTTNIKLTEGN